MNLLLKQLKIISIFSIFCLLMLSGCGGGGDSSAGGGGAGPAPGYSSAKEITAYQADGIAASINQQTKNISFTLPYGTDITKVDVSITITGTSITTGNVTHQANKAGVIALAHDFTSPNVYKVIAIDGTSTNYTATATVASKTDGSMISYSLRDFPNNAATINESSETISLSLPYGTILSKTWVANFTITGGAITVAGAPQVSGETENDFSDLINHPVIYTVTSAAGLVKQYKVVIQIASSTAKDITSFSIGDYEANINESESIISLTLPFNTNLESQIATFATTGASVTVGIPPVLQKSGETLNNFTNPVIYTVTAEDKSIKNYTVNITIALNTDKKITRFLIYGFPDNIGLINESAATISVTLPFNTSLNNLRADFTTTGESVTVGQVTQEPKVTENNFSNGPLTYVVYAADGSTKNYVVTVESAASILKCWGNNGDGRINVPNLKNPEMVSAGDKHTCAIDATGVHCWGDSSYNKLVIPTLTNPKMISAGSYYTCALDDKGVHCWGEDIDGGTNVPTLINPTMVSVSPDFATPHTCAIDNVNGMNVIKCWGNNEEGQLNVPQDLKNPTIVSAGAKFTCAVGDIGEAKGIVKCWGDNFFGQTNSPTFVSSHMQLSVGYYHACELGTDGVHCWGRSTEGETNPPNLTNPRMISANLFNTCAIDDNGVKCWGYDAANRNEVPVGLKKPITVSTGSYHTCAIYEE